MLKNKELGLAIEKAIQLKLDSGGIKSKKEIADHFGIKAPSIHDWIKKGSISKDKLPELFHYFSDVVGYEHWGLSSINVFNMEKRHIDTSKKNDVIETEIPKGLAPLLTWMQAGDWKNIMNSPSKTKGEFMGAKPAARGRGKNTFTLIVENDAMYNPGMSPSFKKGDTIYVDPDASFANEAMAIIKIKSKGEVIFRQIFTIEDKTRYLKALNRDWPNHTIEMTDDHEICGLVIDKYEDISIYNK